MRAPLLRITLLTLAAIFPVALKAQIGGLFNDQATPMPGSGHDYIKMLNETVNPANGQVSLNLAAATPPSRSISLPLSFVYNSAGVHHAGYSGANGKGEWFTDTGTAIGSGWKYSIPTLTAIQGVASFYNPQPPTTYTCTYISNYVLQDLTGNRHSLHLRLSQAGNGNTGCINLSGGGPSNVLNGGDDFFGAFTIAIPDGDVPYLPTAVTAAGPDGTVYYFSHFTTVSGQGTSYSAIPDYIKDRNGNIIQLTLSGGTTTVTDTVGRTAITISPISAGTNSVTISGLTNSYSALWENPAYSFTTHYVRTNSIPGETGACQGFINSVGQTNGYQTITLPNSRQYQFQYDSTFGLLKKVTYPSGGYVSYDWGVNVLSESINFPDSDGRGVCYYNYDTPAISHRYVSFDGVNVALQQDFTYSTTWGSNPGFWSTKQTTVTTHDLIRGTAFSTVYTYAPSIDPNSSTDSSGGQVAVEQAIVYKDFNGNVLRTITKAWWDPSLLGCEIQQLDNNQISGAFYTYARGGQLADKKEYDFGLIGASSACAYNIKTIPEITPPTATPTRETVTNYASFAATPSFPGPSIYNQPSQVIIYGAGARLAETDYAYDQTPVASVSGLSTATHDESYYGPSFNNRANLTTITRLCLQSCTNAVTKSTYDETGQVLTKIDPCGNTSCADMTGTSHTTTYSYADNFDSNPASNTNAYLTRITNPLGQTASFKYAYSDGQLIQSTDANNQVTSYLYGDALRRQTETDRPDFGKTTISYNDTPPAPSVMTTVLQNATSNNIITVAIKDGMGHITQSQLTTDPDGADYTDTVFDGFGHVWKQSNPHRTTTSPTDGTTTNYFDALGRICLVVPPDGTLPTGNTCPTTQPSNTIFTSYSGNVTTVTDQAGKSRRSVTDGLGRLTQVTEDPGGLGYITTYTYDLIDNLQGVLQNGSRQRSFTYDSLSRLACASNPENSSAACPATASGTYTTGTTGYTYDANGNLSAKTSPAPNQTGSATVTLSYCYDALNRLTSKAYTVQSCPMTSPIATYLYDQTAYNGLTITNGIGRRTGMTDQAGVEAWSFDSMGHATTDLRTTNNIAATTTNYFDYAGNLTSIAYPMGGVPKIGYFYNVANRETRVLGFPIGPHQGTFTFADSTFTPAGTPSSIVYGRTNRPPSTPLYSALFYNSRLQPCRISVATTTSVPASCTDSIVGNVLDLSYNFGLGSSDNGNVTSISNNRDSTRSQMFTYDSLNRILTAKTSSTSGTKCWDEQFSYDAWGNLQNIGRISGYSCSNEELLNVVATAKNQLVGYCYDAAGNLVLNTACPQGTFVPTYTYDAENHLISTGGVSYLYDGDGKRVEKVGVALYWYGGGSNLLTETDVTGSVSNSAYHENIFFRGKRIARRDSASNITFQVSDDLGNVRNVISTAGAILDDSDFYPFGGERQYQYTSGNQYKFTGKERDSESGLDNFGARYDSSNLGRFMTPDYFANDTHRANPQSWNLYAYARNNPLRFVDPTGEIVENTDDKKHKLTKAEMNQIARDLQKKTGLSSIKFDKSGQLTYDKSETAKGGSTELRSQITSAIDSQSDVFKLGDYSGSDNVQFAETDAGSVTKGVSTYNVKIDFADFRNAADFSDSQAMGAFSQGLVLSHEIDHKFPTYNPNDNGPGGVIDYVNGIQKQLGLPTRDMSSHTGTCSNGMCSVPFHDQNGQQHMLKWQLENKR